MGEASCSIVAPCPIRSGMKACAALRDIAGVEVSVEHAAKQYWKVGGE